MRPPLTAIDGRTYDAVVVGGGINGAATARELSAAGYEVLLVDRKDFGSGSSGRSSRIMHCGLNYLAAALDARGISEKLANVALARKMMRERARLLSVMPERIRARTFYIPVREADAFRPWQYDLAFRTLDLLSGMDSTLKYRRFRRDDSDLPALSGYFGDGLVGLAAFREYVFDWPERICVDFALDARRNGATVRNHTALVEGRAIGGRWRVSLRDELTDGETASVNARFLVNMAGPQCDAVNAACGVGGGPTVTPNKGCHIAVRLPAEFRDAGIVSRNALGHLFLCVPWKDFHILGPTETVVDRETKRVVADDGDVRSILDQANATLPGLRLTEADVMYRWAGLRPATHDPANPRGTWKRVIHDRSDGDGAPLASLSWGRLADHAFTAADILARVRRALGPRAMQGGRACVLSSDPDAECGLDWLVREELPATLEDILFRRTGDGWSDDLGLSRAGRALDALAKEQASSLKEGEIERYRALLETEFCYREG